MKKNLIYFCAYLLINNAHAGEIVQCTSITGFDTEASSTSAYWTGTPASNVSHTDLQIKLSSAVFHNVRIISTCNNGQEETMTEELQAPTVTSTTATNYPVHCWCKMIRPFGTPWFHSTAYWTGTTQLYYRGIQTSEAFKYMTNSLSNCLYTCPYWCATYLIEQGRLPDDVTDWLANKRKILPETNNNCNLDIPWTLQHIERSGVGFEENCTEIGGIVIPTDTPVLSCKNPLIRNNGAFTEVGTCFKYLPKNTDLNDSTGIYQVSSPCNEYN